MKQLKQVKRAVSWGLCCWSLMMMHPNMGVAATQASPEPEPSRWIGLLQTLLSPGTLTELYYQWGNILHEQEQLIESIQAYQQALQLNPGYRPALINQGLTFIEVLQFDRAIANFQAILDLPDQAIQPASFHTLAHYNLAIIYKRQGVAEGAIAQVKSALQLSPNFTQAQQLLSQLENPPDPKSEP